MLRATHASRKHILDLAQRHLLLSLGETQEHAVGLGEIFPWCQRRVGGRVGMQQGDTAAMRAHIDHPSGNTDTVPVRGSVPVARASAPSCRPTLPSVSTMGLGVAPASSLDMRLKAVIWTRVRVCTDGRSGARRARSPPRLSIVMVEEGGVEVRRCVRSWSARTDTRAR